MKNYPRIKYIEGRFFFFFKKNEIWLERRNLGVGFREFTGNFKKEKFGELIRRIRVEKRIFVLFCCFAVHYPRN